MEVESEADRSFWLAGEDENGAMEGNAYFIVKSIIAYTYLSSAFEFESK